MVENKTKTKFELTRLSYRIMSGHLWRFVYGSERNKHIFKNVKGDPQVKVGEHTREIACGEMKVQGATIHQPHSVVAGYLITNCVVTDCHLLAVVVFGLFALSDGLFSTPCLANIGRQPNPEGSS